MPKAAQSAKRCLAALAARHAKSANPPPQATENTRPPLAPRTGRSTRARPIPPEPSLLEKLQAQHTALEEEVTSLRATAAEQALQLLQAEDDLKKEKEAVTKMKNSKALLASQLRSKETTFEKARKRIGRLKLDKKDIRSELEEKHAQHVRDLEAEHVESCASHVSELESLRTQVKQLSNDLSVALSRLDRLRQSAATHRRAKYALNKKVLRCLEALRRVRSGLLDLRKRLSFDPKEGGKFSAKSRWITRQLTRYGVKPRCLKPAISDTALLFGITLRSSFLGARTAGRINTGESSIWTLLQLAREVKNSMVVTTDGTSHKKITHEATQISHSVPTYDSDVDDSDRSTWVKATRFVSVKEAIRHDAESQHKGKLAVAAEMTDTYNRSPLASIDGSQMRSKTFSRKQLGQCKDHAADGVKEWALAAAEKERDVKELLAEEAYSKVDARTILDAVFSLTEAEVQLAIGKERESGSVSWAERVDIANALLKKKLGHDAYAKLEGQEKDLNTLFIFGGCCSHKDLNAFKYGTDGVAVLWKSGRLTTPQPTLLPNKLLDSIISLGSKAGVDARLKAMDMSTSGGPKFVSLLGAIFRNKDDKKGYQHAGQALVQSYKRELHGDDAISYANIADTNNTRFQSTGKAAVEYVTYDAEYRQTIEAISAAKVKAGANHMELVVLKAMDCRATLMDLIAMGVYMIVVSEPYMIAVREDGKDGTPSNLLLTVNLHRRIASFCDEIADFPRNPFDEGVSLASRTLDGKPVRNRRFIAKCLQAFEWTGDEVLEVVSAMFRGAAKGWRRFTPEFAPDGPIDRLTPFQRSVLYIPATNDHNEGALGTLRLFLRANPCSTTATFNANERMRRNNTEKFITKVSTPELDTWVMREGRTISAKRETAKFKEDVAADYRERADAHERKVAKKLKDAQERLERLRAVGLVTDIALINAMALPALREQLEIHIDIIKDPILGDKKQFRWGMVKTLIPRRMAVIAALGRYQTANPGLLDADSAPSLLPSPMEVDEDLMETPAEGLLESEDDLMDDEYF
ncbi:hypothetical protein BD626DRAFT_629463 [Schizophyllum amplum]|uniref:Uncharacterized protein n=1 Tax=Schizophyllum amplum TaxID=97359 RepID=A0A550CIB7_9AGAR|nr:hypothetical protein BD626DRAFT_629463 [Auriculariopsis ampla]